MLFFQTIFEDCILHYIALLLLNEKKFLLLGYEAQKNTNGAFSNKALFL